MRSSIISIVLMVLSCVPEMVDAGELMFYSLRCDAVVMVDVQDERMQISIIDNQKQLKNIYTDIDSTVPVHLEVADYDFDGNLDFSIWSFDAGMRTHRIYRIFLFSSRDEGNLEARPRCGDEFMNVELDIERKVILSTYFEANVPRLCRTKLPAFD